MKQSKPKKSPEQQQLEENQLERAKELRVEQAKETNQSREDMIAFRNRMRGFRSLLSGTYRGFPS